MISWLFGVSTQIQVCDLLVDILRDSCEILPHEIYTHGFVEVNEIYKEP